MLINCVAYQNGVKLADLPVEEISDYLERNDCFVWVALKDTTNAELEKMQEEFGLRDQMINDQFAADKIIVRYAASFVIQHAEEIWMLGKDIHPMQPVDGERAVDHNASHQQAHSANEIGIRAAAKFT